ncbi:hypothetical protein ACNVED_01835 [Legionella sp. D16C41]|uniref:hypothetical protein n=1 Tax=Legionella sp. D16C41 TaxID=3402688 RepID=UPI003AF6E620
MKKDLISKLFLTALLMLTMAFVQAGTPLWTFTPLTPTTLAVSPYGSATVQYQVTNQSRRTHTLIMRAIPGITQVMTAPGHCSTPFVLGYQQSCILNLLIQGASLSGNIHGGPVVCEQVNPLQCYQPSIANSLNVTKGPSVAYTVGGRVFGLSGTLVLVNNASEALTIHTDGTFTFPSALTPGSTYVVTIQNQPATQTCTVSNGNGTITNANITNITVNCSTNTRTIGGNVAGLAASESVVLQNNGGDNLTINSNGTFTFSIPVAQGAPYHVSILTQPATQTCTVTNGNGIASTTNITNVQVTCATNAYTVGGTVSGLTGTVVLQNNGSDNLSLNSNGPFTFPTPVAEGTTYHVTVLTQPTGQNCSVTNDNGTMGGANITNVAVNCANTTTTLTASTNALALSVTGLVEYGVTGTPNSGLTRLITITNTGTLPAVNMVVTPPTWPTGTTSSTTCPNTLPFGASCTITIIPGNTATSDGTASCSSGTAPIPGVIQVTADNANTVDINVVVLSYGCIYQGGYVYAFDDTTSANTSVGGKVVTTSNQSAAGVIWSSDAQGNVVYDIIYGISETSTPSAPDPSTNQIAGQLRCYGAADGACNTNNIVVYYPTINPILYAAGVCNQSTSGGFSDWYLPAICELGYDTTSTGSGCGSQASPTLQNMQSSLIDFTPVLPIANYWSSTEVSSDPLRGAWVQVYTTNPQQQTRSKDYSFGALCSRALTF